MNVGWGTEANWCYCEVLSVKDTDRLCFSTWASSDKIYFKTYWNEYIKGKRTWEMSAGQG